MVTTVFVPETLDSLGYMMGDIRSAIKAQVHESCDVLFEETIDAALERARIGDVDLLITFDRVKPRPGSGPALDGSAALDLARNVSALENRVGVIVIGHGAEMGRQAIVAACDMIPHCRYVEYDANFHEKLVVIVRTLLCETLADGPVRANPAEVTQPDGGTWEDAPNREPKDLAYVDFYLHSDDVATGRIVELDNGSIIDRGTFVFESINQDTLKDIRVFSLSSEPSNTHWYECLGSAGGKVVDLLRQNPRFLEEVTWIRQKIKDDDRVRFRFVIHPKNMDLLLESVLDWRTEQKHAPDFLLTKMPVYRVYNGSDTGAHGSGSGMDKEWLAAPQPLRCLVIHAGISGTTDVRQADGKFLELQEIKESIREFEEVKKTLEEMSGDNGRVVEVETLDLREGENNRDSLEAKLSQDWDVVHFVGHSYYRSANDLRDEFACIFIPGKRNPEAVGAETLAGWLRNTRFAFFSSCQSASREIVLNLVQKNVPAVLGFRWPVADSSARDFAKCFYKILGSNQSSRCLETAFRRAQSEYRQTCQEKGSVATDPTWATAMLMMQSRYDQRAS